MKKIHKKMTFTELMKENPKLAEKLARKGMFCCGCPMAAQETIEQGALVHGLEIDKLIEELNSESDIKKEDGEKQ